nr:LacI family DNA-binding transcriptional regulator [Anaerotruncus rubiinfantis]
MLIIIPNRGGRVEKYTARDIAELAGVSPATVSRVLNGTAGVGQEKRAKILEIARSLGYAPSGSSYENRRARSSNIVAIFIRDVRNPFYADIIYHAQEALLENGYIPVAMPFKGTLQELQELAKTDVPSSFGGVLMMPPADPEQAKEAVRLFSCPMVLLLNRHLNDFDGNVVIQDNFQAGYTAARHLIELGHRHIAFLMGPADSPAMIARYDAYRQALKNYNLPYRDDYLIPGDLTMECGRRSAQAYLPRLDQLPHALICCNDLMAIGFLDECRKRQVSIPETMSIIGFDDIPFSAVAGIDLTTMRQKSGEMGRRAAELLHKKISAPSSANECVIYDPQLIVRKTTGPAGG